MLFIAAFLALFLLLWLLFIPVGPVIQRALTALGSRTAAFRYRDYVPVALLLTVGIAVTAFAADQFTDLAERVQTHSPVLQEIDRNVHDWARRQRSGVATAFFNFFTYLGTPVALGLIVTAVAGVLAVRRRFRWSGYLIFTTGAGALLVIQLKIFFSRARPDLAEALRTAQGYSFPSGHAMGSTVTFGALSYLILRSRVPWRIRAAGLAAAATTIAAISISRVYLGVHWISDIGGGIAAGTLWVTIATVAYEAFRRIRMIRALRARR